MLSRVICNAIPGYYCILFYFSQNLTPNCITNQSIKDNKASNGAGVAVLML